MEGGGNRYLLGRECKKEDGGADSLIFSNMDAFHNKDVDAQVFDKLRNLKEAQMKIQKDLNQREKRRGMLGWLVEGGEGFSKAAINSVHRGAILKNART